MSVERPLGRHVEHDDRSREFPARTISPAVHRAVLWGRRADPFDQGTLGSCTGNAVVGALETAPLLVSSAQPPLTEADAVHVYAVATRLDKIPGHYPPDDTGSSGLAACRAAKKLGLLTSYRHAFGVVHALGALQFGPVVTGVPWYSGFDTPGERGLVRVAGEVRGGHEFEVLGYDPVGGMVRAVNSWGTAWGDGGYFSFSVSDWARLLYEQGDVTVPHRDPVPTAAGLVRRLLRRGA